MVGRSSYVEKVTRGTDIEIGFDYTPPEGEDRADITMSAYIASVSAHPILEADLVEFDPATGAVIAVWGSGISNLMRSNVAYEARFVRTLGDRSRVLYIRPVEVA